MGNLDYTPFYLKGNGPNIININMINEFLKNNIELTLFFENNDIELKVLNISYFESLCYWVIGQQISGKVAEIFIERLQNEVKIINSKNVSELTIDQFKEIGLTNSKRETLLRLANLDLENRLILDHSKYDSEHILKHYTKIKGIGPWTVNMFMIFSLGRLDVSAALDLVVRKGLKILYNLSEVPDIKNAKMLMRTWGEFGTIGTLLCWRMMGE